MSCGPEFNWSVPDRDGIVTCNLDVGAVSTLKGRRLRKGSVPRPDQVALWGVSWCQLLILWLKKQKTRSKWTSLQLIAAGSDRVHDARPLLDALLHAGLVMIEESRESGRWQLMWVEFLDLEAVRELVGLANREKRREVRAGQGGAEFQHPALTGLQQSLDGMPTERAIRRHEILVALDRWIVEGYDGTRRDFALYAMGDTKAITPAEWQWIDETLPLEGIGIGRHTPALWLRAPLALAAATGTLDLRFVPDCIGLTPQTIEAVVRIEGEIGCWRILENRTVFERVAKQRGSVDGVLWVPGFAPTWWREAVAVLLKLSPAPVLVACDPDPAGIEIALQVGAMCTAAGAAWEPWCMDAVTLQALPKKKPLVADDISRLQRLLSGHLPEMLKELASWMLDNGEKGEQEGISF